ncbi:DUF6716 putative glycosyltransferase [Actinocorallia longicatena]|uniref:Uncharacterized protein n=1 Tax=Actinocorallia longicatena TaxID=111803 RepID=A0ABP6QKW9_9ACTN
MKLLAIADSDSYLKWAAALLRGLPAGYEHRLVVVRSPIAPSREQRAAAVSGSGQDVPPVLSGRALRALLRSYDPDAVLLASTGPVVRVLSEYVCRDRRRILLTGLPGISVPASPKAWRFRSSCDLFIVHSTREVAEFTEIAAGLGIPGRVVKATLPFLAGAPADDDGERDRVVFATQAKVPVLREERERILFALAGLAAARPDLRVVVKLRARAHEEQTHREFLHYETLWGELDVDRSLLTFDAGPMHAQLAHAAGFVTVSSTAALEAIAAGVPVNVLSDFGVSAEMINLVFEDSGVLGTLGDLAQGTFRAPDPAWRAANYFHPAAENDWVRRLEELACTELPPVVLHSPSRWGRARAGLRVELPPVAYRRLVKARNALRGTRSSTTPSSF